MANAQLDSTRISPVDPAMIYAPVAESLEGVRQSLKALLPRDSEWLEEAISHSMQAGGKLLRPVVALLASGATGAMGTPHVEMAAVAELIHVATLLHDDVLDDADLRRGRTTVRNRWGNTVSILSGDYLLAQASLKLSQLNNCRLVSIFARVLSDLCDGEVEQIRTRHALDTTWDSYFHKTVCKTASLFAACCESAGVLNGLAEPDIQSLKTYGESFGIAFQIVDDLLDYTASEASLGKPVLDDLKNGLLNAPILLARDAFPAESLKRQALEQVIRAMAAPETETTRDGALKTRLYELIGEADALEATQRLSQNYVDRAIDALSFLPDSPYKTALVQLTHYATVRER